VDDAMDRALPGGDVQPGEPRRSAVVTGLGITQILAWGPGVDCLGPDEVSFGEIKRRAFSILERDKIKRAADFIGAHFIDVTALEWGIRGPVFKERIRTDFSNPFFKKCEERERQADACLSGCYNG
jgi:hypothetical protein